MFTQFGELEDAIVTTDRVTGKSKGYGFITFRYAAGASAAIAEPEKQLDVSRLANSLKSDLGDPDNRRHRVAYVLVDVGRYIGFPGSQQSYGRRQCTPDESHVVCLVYRSSCVNMLARTRVQHHTGTSVTPSNVAISVTADHSSALQVRHFLFLPL